MLQENCLFSGAHLKIINNLCTFLELFIGVEETINILFTFLEQLQDIRLFGVVLVGVKNNGFWKVQIFQGLP